MRTPTEHDRVRAHMLVSQRNDAIAREWKKRHDALWEAANAVYDELAEGQSVEDDEMWRKLKDALKR